MDTKIDILREKYPYHKIKCEPQEKCKVCKGTGEHLNGYGEMTLCICTCVGLDGIGELFNDFVKRELKELRKNQ